MKRRSRNSVTASPEFVATLAEGIRQANQVRRLLDALRRCVYGGTGASLPALEMLIAEMLAIHFCSDRAECIRVLTELLDEAAARRSTGQFGHPDNRA